MQWESETRPCPFCSGDYTATWTKDAWTVIHTPIVCTRFLNLKGTDFHPQHGEILVQDNTR